MIEIILAITTLLAAFWAWTLQQKINNNDKKYSETELQEQILQKAEEIRKEKQAQLDEFKQELKEKLEEKNDLVIEKMKLQMHTEMQDEEKKMRQRILDLQENVDRKENQLEQKLIKLEEDKVKLEEQKDELRQIKQQLLEKKNTLEKDQAEITNLLQTKLEEIAKLSESQAKEKILDKAKEEMGQELISWQHKIVENAQEEANLKAREIVALAVQRCSSEVANEFTITTIKLSSEEDKGKIIGKQGRNIQWLEKTLGVELIIDETPEIVTISGFSSIRRNIAKRTLEKLLADGRIHPVSIEEMYQKAKAEIAQEIAEAGEWATNELGIYDFPAKLIRLIGRLKYRTSYGQNMLKHSVEMAKLAGLLADEMNEKFVNRTEPIDRMTCVKGALLHDIGKALDEEMTPKGNHIEIGEKVCDMFDLDWKIKKCISSHHNENYWDGEKGFCIEAVLVDACDNISGSRPGARKETAEAYFQRLEALERVTESVPGVNKSWIMRGSRELWVFFDTDNITASQMHDITRKIAQDIGSSVKSPFQIKVTGFLENRAVEFAG